MDHDGWLDETDLAKLTVTRNRIGMGVEEYPLRADADGG
jgi:hypothetical protein